MYVEIVISNAFNLNKKKFSPSFFSLLGFQSSFSKTLYLEEDLLSVP